MLLGGMRARRMSNECIYPPFDNWGNGNLRDLMGSARLKYLGAQANEKAYTDSAVNNSEIVRPLSLLPLFRFFLFFF